MEFATLNNGVTMPMLGYGVFQVTIVTNNKRNSLTIMPIRNPPAALGKYVVFCIGK